MKTRKIGKEIKVSLVCYKCGKKAKSYKREGKTTIFQCDKHSEKE